MKFTFDWLFSKERKKLRDKVEKLEQKIEELYSQPYKKVRSIDGNIIVVLNNGNILNGKGEGLLEKIVEAKSEEEVITLLKSKKEESKEIEVPEDDLLIFKNNTDFEIKEGKLYLKDINCVIPELIVATFIEILEKMEAGNVTEMKERYQALILFTMKLFLNPIESSRNDLIRFVNNNDIRITNLGNMLLYRRIVKTTEEENPLVDFVSINYIKVKKNKKSPKNYWVINKDGAYSIIKSDNKPKKDSKSITKGNLYDLYNNLSHKSSTYTDAHTKSMTIKIGEVYSIPEEDCDVNSRASCSKGLNVAPL